MDELKKMAAMMNEAGDQSNKYEEWAEQALASGDAILYRQYKVMADVSAERAAGLYEEIKARMA